MVVARRGDSNACLRIDGLQQYDQKDEEESILRQVGRVRRPL
jgi:hypothetical protein